MSVYSKFSENQEKYRELGLTLLKAKKLIQEINALADRSGSETMILGCDYRRDGDRERFELHMYRQFGASELPELSFTEREWPSEETVKQYEVDSFGNVFFVLRDIE